jgi:hypothetical protein
VSEVATSLCVRRRGRVAYEVGSIVASDSLHLDTRHFSSAVLFAAGF